MLSLLLNNFDLKMPSKDKILLVKGSKTGLGDRIRAVLAGLIYAEYTNRSISVDWRDGMYGPLNENVFDVFFEVKNLRYKSVSSLDDADVMPLSWKDRIHKSMDCVYIEDGAPPWDREQAIKKYSIDFGDVGCKNSILVSWEFTQLEKLRPLLPIDIKNESIETIEKWAWRRYLKFTPEIEGEIDKFFEGINGNTVGLHIRATNEFSLEKGGVGLDKYFTALDRILKKIDVQRIMVATDNTDVLRAMMERYPQATSQPKWFAKPGDPIHLDSSCPDAFQMAKDALIEMGALGRCDWLLSIGNSSYSIMARVMSTASSEQHVIFFPKKNVFDRVRNRISRMLK